MYFAICDTVPFFDMYFNGWLSGCLPEPSACLIRCGPSHQLPSKCQYTQTCVAGPGLWAQQWAWRGCTLKLLSRGNRRPGVPETIAELSGILPLFQTGPPASDPPLPWLQHGALGSALLFLTLSAPNLKHAFSDCPLAATHSVPVDCWTAQGHVDSYL